MKVLSDRIGGTGLTEEMLKSFVLQNKDGDTDYTINILRLQPGPSNEGGGLALGWFCRLGGCRRPYSYYSFELMKSF